MHKFSYIYIMNYKTKVGLENYSFMIMIRNRCVFYRLSGEEH